METLLAIGVGAYGATTASYLASLWSPRPAFSETARWLLRFSLGFWALVLGFWIFREGSAGGTRLLLGISAWALGGIYLLLLRRYPITSLGSFVLALATVLSLLGLMAERGEAFLPGGVANWLLRIHIGLAFIGITVFAFASAVSLVYLLQERMLKSKSKSPLRARLPNLDVLDTLSLRGIVAGFPFYTVALLLGSVQAVKQGELSFRPAYVAAVVSWLIYAGVLQARLTAGWRGRRAAVLTICGLLAALTTVLFYSFGLA